jgi:hypothetical protein
MNIYIVMYTSNCGENYQIQFLSFFFRITQKINKKLSGSRNTTAAEFPQPPGSHLPRSYLIDMYLLLNIFENPNI